jgi:hypothetical protein
MHTTRIRLQLKRGGLFYVTSKHKLFYKLVDFLRVLVFTSAVIGSALMF